MHARRPHSAAAAAIAWEDIDGNARARLDLSTYHESGSRPNVRTQFIDLTDRLEALVAEAGIRFGFVNLQTLHTTTAIVVNEREPLLLADFATLLEHAAPRDAGYRHDDVTVAR